MSTLNPTGSDHSSDAADREPRELKAESDAIREDLQNTLSELERKFSPRDLIDRSLEYVNENGGELLQKIGDTVSKNPLPLLVTSAGLIWLFASSRSSASSQRTSQPFADRYPADEGVAARASNFVGDQAQGLKHRARETLDAARSRASETWETTREHAHQYGDSLHSFVRDQPLACGAIAVAAGAVIGAAFPASTYERDLVARARTGGSSKGVDGPSDTLKPQQRGAGGSSSSLSH